MNTDTSNTPGGTGESEPAPAHPRPTISIRYCTQCNWMLRSAWLAQELLSTFAQDLHQVALLPASGGIFEIHVNTVLVWERKRDGGFPEAKVLKQRVRDIVFPERDLGHSDRKPPAA